MREKDANVKYISLFRFALALGIETKSQINLMVKPTNSKSHIMNHMFCFFSHLVHGNTREILRSLFKEKIEK